MTGLSSRGGLERRARDVIRVAQAHTAWFATVVGIVCAVGILISETVFANSPFRPAATSILGSILSGAVVSVAADLVLRDRFAHAFAVLVRIRDDVRESGLNSIAMTREPDWAWVLADADSIDVVLIDPYPWLSRWWSTISSLAQSRGLALRVLFVAPASQACIDLEARLGRSVTTSCSEAEQLIKGEWERLRRSSSLDDRAEVGLFNLTFAPAYDLVLSRRNNRWQRAGVIIGPSAHPMPTTEPLGMTFESAKELGGDVGAWAERQISVLVVEAHRVWAGDAQPPLPQPSDSDGPATDTDSGLANQAKSAIPANQPIASGNREGTHDPESSGESRD